MFHSYNNKDNKNQNNPEILPEKRIFPYFVDEKNNPISIRDVTQSSIPSKSGGYEFVMQGNVLFKLLEYMQFNNLKLSMLGIDRIKHLHSQLKSQDFLLDKSLSIERMMNLYQEVFNDNHAFRIYFKNFDEVKKYQLFLQKKNESRIGLNKIKEKSEIDIENKKFTNIYEEEIKNQNVQRLYDAYSNPFILFNQNESTSNSNLNLSFPTDKLNNNLNLNK